MGLLIGVLVLCIVFSLLTDIPVIWCVLIFLGVCCLIAFVNANPKEPTAKEKERFKKEAEAFKAGLEKQSQVTSANELKHYEEFGYQKEQLEQFKQERQKAESDYNAMLDAIPSVNIAVSDKPAPILSTGWQVDMPASRITKKSNIDKLSNFVVIDTETTGLSLVSSEIVEIAAIRFKNFEAVEKFSTLCYPKKGINPQAAKINGITESMVDGKPSFRDIAASLREFIGNDSIVAHNLPFDLKFITRYGVDLETADLKYYDTLTIARRVVVKSWVENYKLDTLCRYYGIKHYSGHRALADAWSTGKLFESLVSEIKSRP